MPAQTQLGYRKVDHFYANSQYQHAWPLLSHDDLGNSDQSNQTKNILYSMYMPKRNKGTAPWFRGADTYSVKYSEQGRYEYQRYLMINRFPSEYKKHFLRFVNNIRGAGASSAVPQEALHWLLRMIVDNFNPQHIHYIAAMKTLLHAREVDMARDVWKIMERQQTWPDTTTLCTYLDVCVAAREPTWAMEAWNRYATELRFLQHGEVDPKPITRVPFSLTREELLYLPKWKKHFDHDPNLDVTDLNRFNKTREVYLRMALVMLRGREGDLYWHFFNQLEKAMLSTPTPIPEPPNPHLVRRPRWKPYEHVPSVHASPWRLQSTERSEALGPTTVAAPGDAMSPRFFTNIQYLVHAVRECIEVVIEESLLKSREDASHQSSTEPFFLDTEEESVAFCTSLLSRLHKHIRVVLTEGEDVMEDPRRSMKVDERALLTTYLRMLRELKHLTGAQLLQEAQAYMKASCTVNESVPEALTAAHYLEVLKGLADECAFTLQRKAGVEARYEYRNASLDPKAVIHSLSLVLKEIAANPHIVWSADMHLEVVKVLVGCGTMKANEYFVQNVLRQFQWSSEFLEHLYMEYRRHESVELWAELTKRSLVWTARYDVQVSETLKRLIEDDYDLIGVHTRTFRELAVFQFKDVEEKRHARQVVNDLPNPWVDYVSHALPFPDRDAGYPDEYGDIGQWRAPGGPGSPVKGPGYYAPPMEGEHQRGYTAEWRDLKNPMRPPTFPSPWDRKYRQYERGQHPSYDMVYAGPMPEVFPGRHNFRKPTRWDYHDIEKQGKFKISGPY